MAHLTSEGRRISTCINQPGYVFASLQWLGEATWDRFIIASYLATSPIGVPQRLRGHVKSRKKKSGRIRFMKYWWFNRDPDFMVY